MFGLIFQKNFEKLREFWKHGQEHSTKPIQLLTAWDKCQISKDLKLSETMGASTHWINKWAYKVADKTIDQNKKLWTKTITKDSSNMHQPKLVHKR